MAGQYDAGEAFLQILPSMRGFAQRVKNGLRGVRVEFEVPVSVALDRAGLAGLRTALRALPAVVLDADSTPADREIAAVRDRIEQLSARTIGLDISGDAARAELASIQADLERLGASAPSIGVRVDAAAAEAALGGVQREVSRLDGRRVNARVVVDAGQAIASVIRLGLAVNAFANRSYRFRLDVDTAGAVARIGLVASAVFALGGGAGAILGLGGAIAGLGAAGAVAVAGIAPAVLAFRGVFDAVKALAAQQETAAVDAQAAAQKQSAAAAAVASAQGRLSQASTAAGRARTEASRAVADADKRLRQETADLEREQRALTSAWEAGRRSLQDLQDQVDGNALDQRQLAFDLKDARAALVEAEASGDAEQIDRAQLAVDRLIESQDQLSKRTERAQADNTAAQAAGIAGTSEMVAATDRVAAAEGRVADARSALEQARVDGAQRVADADLQVIEAQRALTQALAQTGDIGSSAAQKVQQAFAGLSPEAADFARYIFGLKPLLDELSATAAGRFFPALRDGMDTLITRAPLINSVVGDLAEGMGLGLQLVLTELASPYWSKFFAVLGAVATTLIPRFFESLMTLAGAAAELIRFLLPIAPAAMDVFDQFSGLLVILAPFIAQLLGGLLPAASALLTALAPLGPVLAALTPILAVLGEAFATVLIAVLEALAPILVALTPLIAEFATQWAVGLAGALTAATPLLVGLAGWLSDNAETIVWLTGVVGGIVAAFQPLLWVLGLIVTALHGWLILKIAGAALSFLGLQGTWVATVVTKLLSPISLLRMALPFIGQAIMWVGRMILGALGPMGILLTVLGYLYTSNEEFRNAVNGVFAVLGQLVGILVSSLQPAFEQVMAAIAPLIPMLLDALMPVLNMVAAVFVDLITTVLPPIIAFVVGQLIPIIVTLANILATVLVWIISNVVVPAIQLFAWILANVVAPTIMWLYENVVKPAFERIGALIAWVWGNIIKPALDFFVFLLTKILGPAINWLWQNIVRPAFETIGTIIRVVWENVISPAFVAIGDALGWLGRGFDDAVATIGRIWNNLRNLLAVPINFLIGTVFNNGIRKAWNLVADLLPGVDPIGELPLIPEFAAGGPVTRDTVLRAGEAGPEYILSAPAVDAMGGLGAAEQFHRALTGRGGPRRPYETDETGGPAEASLFAGGQTWGRLAAAVYGAFPTARITSTVRRGDDGYHGRGMAVDVAGPRSMDTGFMSRVNRWIASTFPASTELIYTPGINLRHGAPHTYNAGTRADHFDHVHWALADRAVGDDASAGGGGYNWFEQRVVDLIDSTTNPIIDAIPFRAPPKFLGIPREAAATIRDQIKTFLVGEGQKEDGAAGAAGGAGVERWRGLVEQALRIVGQPLVHTNRTLRRMNQESGGNPRAINLWDSNARKGIPSKGLMQVIDPTFAAHRDRGLPNDVYDPLANVVASMRYALSRYRNLPSAYDRAGGYDSGGVGKGIGWMWKGTGLDERVLPPQETQAYPTLTRLSQQLEAGRVPVPAGVSAAQYKAALAAGPRGGDGPGDGETHLHFHEVPWTPERMLREADRRRDMARRTR